NQFTRSFFAGIEECRGSGLVFLVNQQLCIFQGLLYAFMTGKEQRYRGNAIFVAFQEFLAGVVPQGIALEKLESTHERGETELFGSNEIVYSFHLLKGKPLIEIDVIVVFDEVVYFFFEGIKEYRVFIDILEEISAHSLLVFVQAKFLIVFDHDFVIEQYPALCYLVCYHGFSLL